MADTRKPTSTDSLAAAFDAVVERHRGTGTRLAVGYSGGLDSSATLYLAVDYCRRHGVSLEAVHCHHALSPDADAWADHCRATAERYRIPIQLINLAITNSEGDGIEAAARKARYRVFDNLNADLVLLGHHANDQAETILLNLCRGSGVLGLAGIPERKGRYVRPLLGIRRPDIETYARQKGLQWCEDESNSNPDYRRNFLRLELIPQLEVRYPKIEETLAETATRFANAQQLLDELATLDSGEVPLSFPYPTGQLRAISHLRAANLLRLVLRLAGLQAPPEIRLDEFLRQIREARPDRHPELKLGKVSLEVRRKQVHLVPSR